ncbi:MAG: biotin/lipoyl-binding protein [Ignavibacteriota bacterium]
MDGHISAIAPKITGNVLEVAVLDNQQVKAGDVLVRIDPRDYQALSMWPRPR